MAEEGSMEKSEMEKQLNLKRAQNLIAGGGSKAKKQASQITETITPDKYDYQNNHYASMESLKARKRRPSSTFKRREALNKKGWDKSSDQLTMDKFLVPKKRKKVDNAKFMMMGCSDSYSCMPSNYEASTGLSSRPQYRSKKRINKLVGKQKDGPLTRSRLASKDFTTGDEFSYFSSLQDIKRKKRGKLSHLKHSDMLMMSA